MHFARALGVSWPTMVLVTTGLHAVDAKEAAGELVLDAGDAIFETSQPLLPSATESADITTSSAVFEPQVTAVPSAYDLEARDAEERAVTVTATNSNNNKTTKDDKPTVHLTSSSHTTAGPPRLTSAVVDAAVDTNIPAPVVTVPPMANNPYLLKSNLPEGTVFIAVGAILLGIAAALVIWRVVAAYSLHKALKRDEAAALLAEDELKSPMFGASPVKTRSRVRDSVATFSLAGDTAENRKSVISQNVPGHSLFFSPTAEVLNTANGTGIGTMASAGGTSASSTLGGPSAGVRSSVYLPAGYYGAGNSAPTAGHGSITSRNTRHLSMARESVYDVAHDAQSVRHSLYAGVTPRDQVQSARPPSMFLDDLLAASDDDE